MALSPCFLRAVALGRPKNIAVIANGVPPTFAELDTEVECAIRALRGRARKKNGLQAASGWGLRPGAGHSFGANFVRDD